MTLLGRPSSPTSGTSGSRPWLSQLKTHCQDVVATHASEVDQQARFPAEGVDGLKQMGLLSMGLPSDLGGLGASLNEILEAIYLLAQHCSSTAMVFAMHQIQVACLLHHHGQAPELLTYLQRLSTEQLLLASITSEGGVGGNIRQSRTHVEALGQTGLQLHKEAPTISYGAHASGYLVTARRHSTANPGDQVLVLVERQNSELIPTTHWNTLGMRGTCSGGFSFHGTFSPGHVFAEPFESIAARTMLPISHLVWSACWLGIAQAALHTAMRYLKHKGERSTVLVRASSQLDMLHHHLLSLSQAYQQILAGDSEMSELAFNFQINTLKVNSSEWCLAAVQDCMAVCGIAGYSEESPYSISRFLRDLHSAPIMVHNERILSNAADAMLLNRKTRRWTP